LLVPPKVLEFSTDKARRDEILAHLLRHPGFRDPVVEGARERNEVVQVPCSDIIVLNHNGGETFTGPLVAQLRTRYWRWVETFSVKAVPATNMGDKPMCFLGPGVFCPPDDAVPVAHVEFRNPSSPNRAVAVPTLVGNWGPVRPAAWYDGQTGLVVGFEPTQAAARLDLDVLGLTNTQRGDLLDKVIFIGRPYDANLELPPIFEVLERTTDGGYVQADWTLRNEADGWYRNEAWSELKIGSLTLEFRIRRSSGVARFVAWSDTDTDTVSPGWAVVEVVGLIAPPLALPVEVYLGRRPRRWIVQFTHNGALRCSELMPRVITLVGQSGERYSRYDGNRHQGTSSASADTLSFDVGGQRVVGAYRVDIDAWANNLLGTDGGKIEPDIARWLEETYPPLDTLMLAATVGETLGALSIPPDEWHNVVPQVVPQNDPRVSLDWLDRAAMVETDRMDGLASHWFRTFGVRVHVQARPDGLVVRTSDAGSDNWSIEYVIGPGHTGPLGPLSIRYVGIGPETH
jgi:hypothetical protein